jgi:DedD protein
MGVDDGLKQRLVGAFVLLALGVLFIPVVFDRDGRLSVDRTSQIPPAPKVTPLVKIPDPVRPEGIEPAKVPEQMYKLVESEAVKPSPSDAPAKAAAQPVKSVNEGLTSKGIPKAWTVQLVSYKTVNKASALRDKLIKDGYKAYTRTLKTSKGTVTRVYVGPKVEKAKAFAVKRQLDKSLKVESLVLRFEP